jgi:hypothetical protein
MTAGSGPPRDGAPQDRADLFVADFYPKLDEYLAEQHAAGYDAGPGQARFQTWLGEHPEGTAGADPVREYLKQIGKIPGLTIEQEAELAQRIEAGLAAERKLAEDGDHLTPGERIGDLIAAVGEYERQMRDYSYAAVAASQAAEAETGARHNRLMFWLYRRMTGARA